MLIVTLSGGERKYKISHPGHRFTKKCKTAITIKEMK
jgi:hypothetical protein